MLINNERMRSECYAIAKLRITMRTIMDNMVELQYVTEDTLAGAYLCGILVALLVAFLLTRICRYERQQ